MESKTFEGRIIELLRQAASGELKHISKINKDVFVAVVQYVAPRIINPQQNKELVDMLVNTNSGQDCSTTCEDVSLDFSSTQPEQNTLEANCSAGETATSRPRLCKSRWVGSVCKEKGCDRGHPEYCKDAGCKVRRRPECPLWHVTRRSGNLNRRAAAPSIPKSGQSKDHYANGVKHSRNVPSAKELKLQLLASQVQAYKAKEQLEAYRLKERKGKTRSYAQVASSKGSQSLTQGLSNLPVVQPVACQQVPGSGDDNLIELLRAVLVRLTRPL